VEWPLRLRIYYILTEYGHCQVTWNGTNLNLPKQLPVVAQKVHRQTPYQYRYYLNYCTFNYSMSWWDWDRWQKEIDWMALHGINMPLAVTGEEYTWYLVYKDLGFSDDDLKDFFCGPSYFSWFWMGQPGWLGRAITLNWMQSHKELQQKILRHERELGMMARAACIYGHVPPAFKKKFPNAKLKATNWNNGFADTIFSIRKIPCLQSSEKNSCKLKQNSLAPIICIPRIHSMKMNRRLMNRLFYPN
jgi:alpha-N-acetylglucosaminidase